MKYTLAVLVSNQPGVLNRVTSMFRRRQFNISSLTVGCTENPEVSRITTIFEGNEESKEQLVNQLYKLQDVMDVKQLHLKSAAAELLKRVQNRVMLKRRGNNMSVTALFADLGCRKQRLIISLTSAGGEIDLLRTASEE